MSFEERLRADLGDLPLALAPPADLSDTVLAGARRSARRRALVVAGGVAIAVAAAVVTAPVLLRTQAGPVPPADQTCGSPVPARPQLPTWERFDPLVSEIDTSGVTGFGYQVVVTSTFWQMAFLDSPDWTVTVIVYACGGEPQLSVDGRATPVDPATGEAADPVRGAPAYWLEEPASLLGLAWQWTPGSWAMVLPSEVDLSPTRGGPDEMRTIAAQVAQQLELGVGTPVTAPFSLPLPEGTYAAITLTPTASDNGAAFPTGFSIGFSTLGTAEPTSPPFTTDYLPYLGITATSFAAVDDLPQTAMPYPEDLGYPAYQDVYHEGNLEAPWLRVFDVFGLGIDIIPAGVPGTQAERLSLAADVFRSITVHPGAADDLSVWAGPISPSSPPATG